MRKIITLVLSLAFISTSCTNNLKLETPDSHTQGDLMTKLVGGLEGDFKQGELLIEIDESYTARLLKGEGAIMNEILSLAEAEEMVPALMIRPKNMAIAKKYGLHRWFMLSFDEEKSLYSVAEKVAQSSCVKKVQFNSLVQPINTEKAIEFLPTPMTRSGEVSDMPFNDPYLANQWNLINTGNTEIASNAVAGADVGVKDAWKLTGGDPSVIVAVFDCAVNNMHEDLKKAVWVNEEEKAAGYNQTDDDGNGFIDDMHGFNFVGCSAITKTKIEEFWNEGEWDGPKLTGIKGSSLDWSAGSGHGTHVAGIIGAVNGNGKGVSSIAGGTDGNGGVRLMTCQIFSGARSTSDAQNAAAYIYAADNGACIAQCSYGNSAVITNDNDYINGNEDMKIDGSKFENLALQYFLDPANSNHESLDGNIAVFAAGNHKNPYSSYPGALSYVLSVTAFGADFLPGGYTNYGPGCNIAAPGGEFYDGYSYGRMVLSTGVSNAAQVSPAIDEDKNYQYMQGTSMACPHVSGVIALGLSYAKKLGKKFTREELTSLLLTSTNDIDQYLKGTKRYYDLGSYTWSDIQLNQYKGQLGTGAVDAWKFLMAIEGTPSVLVAVNKTAKIDLDEYLGEGVADRLSIKVDIDAQTRQSLGLQADPVVINGKLEICCKAIGAGKITLSSAVGKDTTMENGIGEMEFSREISIVSRPFATENGGWL